MLSERYSGWFNKAKWEIAVHLAVAGDIFDGVFFPRDVLHEIWDFIESVSECFPTYFR